jgi:hypothetical protein
MGDSNIRITKIRKIIGDKELYIGDFLRESPYTIEELRARDKSQDLVAWRHVGIVWLRLSGYSCAKAGGYFGRHHATVIHAEKRVFNHLTGFADADIKSAFDMLKKRAEEPFHLTDNVHQNAFMQQKMMEANLFRSINNGLRQKIYPAFGRKASSVVVNDCSIN